MACIEDIITFPFARISRIQTRGRLKPSKRIARVTSFPSVM